MTMNHTFIVNESVLINAAPAKVWETLTDPATIKEFLFGTETITDWKLGSPIVFQGVYGEKSEHRYRDKGVILRSEPPTLLSYSYWSGFSGLEDAPENYAIVTYLLEARGSQTLFTWRQQGYPNVERFEHSRQGMKDLLAQIKVITER